MQDIILLFILAVIATALSVTFILSLAYLVDTLQSRITGKRLFKPLFSSRHNFPF